MRALQAIAVVTLGVSLCSGAFAAAEKGKAPEADLLHSVLSMEGPKVRVLGVNPDAALKNFRLAATPWSQALGTRVSAQGVLWEADRAPFVGRLVLDGDSLYLKGDAIAGKDLNGRLVRLEGKLPVGTLEATGDQVFFIAVERVEPIERITSPYLWDARKQLGR